MLFQSFLKSVPVKGAEKLVGVQRQDDIVCGMADTEVSGSGKIINPCKLVDMIRELSCGFQGVIF